MRHTTLHWELARLSNPNETPNVWFPATVPGAVQRDYANAQGWQPGNGLAVHLTLPHKDRALRRGHAERLSGDPLETR